MYRLSIEQYEAMAEAEILTDRDQVELVDGLLVRKMTKKPAHSVAARAVAEALARLVPEGYFVTREDPIRVGSASEPEPDAAVVRGRSRDYARRHPDAAQTVLVVEVSDSSVSLDRTEKLRVYAGGGIPVYWIVNLVELRVEVHARPEAGVYQDVRSLDSTEAVAVVMDGREVGAIAVADLLP
jgi:Uma2 family endonuclease